MTDSLALKPKQGNPYSLYIAKLGVDGQIAQRSVPWEIRGAMKSLTQGAINPDYLLGGAFRRVAPGIHLAGALFAMANILYFAKKRGFKQN